MKKENRGGKRENAGRLPIKDKLVQIPIGVRRSVIEKLGRKEVVRLLKKAVLNIN